MVRRWQAIDRLLWSVAVAYALLQVAASHPTVQALRQGAAKLLHWWGYSGAASPLANWPKPSLWTSTILVPVGAREICGNWK